MNTQPISLLVAVVHTGRQRKVRECGWRNAKEGRGRGIGGTQKEGKRKICQGYRWFGGVGKRRQRKAEESKGRQRKAKKGGYAKGIGVAPIALADSPGRYSRQASGHVFKTFASLFN